MEFGGEHVGDKRSQVDRIGVIIINIRQALALDSTQSVIRSCS